MKITIDNYESWFLDFMEGNLNSEELEGVRSFMRQHPELAAELDNFLPALKPDNQNFAGKEMLKKSIFHDTAHFETTSIAAIEGDLSPEEKSVFIDWLEKNPVQQKFYLELEKCKLLPNPEISFPAKGRLKKKTISISPWIKVAGAAAVLLIALLTFYPEERVSKIASPVANNSSQGGVQKEPIKEVISEKSLTLPSSAKANIQKLNKKRPNLYQIRRNKVPKIMLAEAREKIIIQSLDSKSTLVQSYVPDLTDLMPVKENESLYAASNEISLSDFLKSKLKELRASGPKEYYTREEVTVAGLHLFSRLPGNHLTGKKGSDGRLTTISFNTHLLAFTIPVNR
jgi:hypothetical protein